MRCGRENRHFMALAAGLVLAAIFCSAPSSNAGWLDESIGMTTTTPVSEFSQGAYLWGGSTRVHLPNSTVRPFRVNLPSVTSGCGGIDAFWGGFSMLDPDYLVQYAQNIISAAPGYAFNLALQSVCENCHAIMQELQAIANELNATSLDSCAASEFLVNKGGGLVNDMLGREVVKGRQEGTAPGWLVETRKTVSTMNHSVNEYFDDKASSGELSTLARRIAVPDVPNRGLSLWMTVVGERMTSGSFNSYGPGYEAVKNFFRTPAHYIQYIRSVTGDFVYWRGTDGNTPSSLLSGILSFASENNEATPGKKPQPQEVPPRNVGHVSGDKVPTEKDYQEIIDIGGDEISANTLVSIVSENRLIVTDFEGIPISDNYMTASSTGSGWIGFAMPSANNGQISPKDAIVYLANPEIAGCATPKDCMSLYIDNIFDNLTATGGGGGTVGTSEGFDNYARFSSMPVYLYVNRVGMMSVKYPAILPETRDNLSQIAAYSFIVARLNAALDYADELLSDATTAAMSLSDNQFVYGNQLQTWVIGARQLLVRQKTENIRTMTAMTRGALEEVTANLKKYMDVERAIKEVVTGSEFVSAYNTEK